MPSIFAFFCTPPLSSCKSSLQFSSQTHGAFFCNLMSKFLSPSMFCMLI